MESWLIVKNELDNDILELQNLGLNEEEIEGYLEMFWENYFPDQYFLSNSLLN